MQNSYIYLNNRNVFLEISKAYLLLPGQNKRRIVANSTSGSSRCFRRRQTEDVRELSFELWVDLGLSGKIK